MPWFRVLPVGPLSPLHGWLPPIPIQCRQCGPGIEKSVMIMSHSCYHCCSPDPPKVIASSKKPLILPHSSRHTNRKWPDSLPSPTPTFSRSSLVLLATKGTSLDSSRASHGTICGKWDCRYGRKGWAKGMFCQPCLLRHSGHSVLCFSSKQHLSLQKLLHHRLHQNPNPFSSWGVLSRKTFPVIVSPLLLHAAVSFYNYYYYYYWGTIALQYFASFCCTESKSAIYTHTYICVYLFPLGSSSHPSRSSQRAELSALYIRLLLTIYFKHSSVYMSIPTSQLFRLAPPHTKSTHPFSMSASLFLPCK